ncbi:MAG: S-ribosylhomocysteine lyase [Candidatus Merdivicinus sp.]|jgi:S-ribosylhomocysteine lyase
MKRIESFCVNHNKLKQGLYLSRVDGDAVTYDLRMVIPNGGVYLENDGIHTFEHLFATYVRNTEYADQVIYVGPMGCRTGFYFIVRDKVSKEEVIALLQRTMDFIAGYEGEIPGASAIECGNYRDHNLEKARRYAVEMREYLKDWTPEKMKYQQ